MTHEEGLSIALIDAEDNQVESLKEHLPDIDWRPGTPDPDRSEETPNAVIVFAKTHEEEAALSRCRSLRDSQELSNTPVLVAITIYQMPLGNQVKKLTNCDLVFFSVKDDGPPIQREDLFEKLRGLESESSSA